MKPGSNSLYMHTDLYFKKGVSQFFASLHPLRFIRCTPCLFFISVIFHHYLIEYHISNVNKPHFGRLDCLCLFKQLVSYFLPFVFCVLPTPLPFACTLAVRGNNIKIRLFQFNTCTKKKVYLFPQQQDVHEKYLLL